MIRDYAKISKPLTNALRKDIKINTENKEYREAFEQLKLLLQNNPILQLPDAIWIEKCADNLSEIHGRIW
ncbi:hypothetical protein ACUWCL_29170, partial [Klebsiella pneumoniae]|uniref:hypothetical protein n=1 Tax=Klebsiella pneumoniae TaxID=573 RepID=UPI0040554746